MVRRSVLGGLVAVLLVTCASAAPRTGLSELAAVGVQRQMPGADAPLSAVTDGITAFGYALSKASAEPGRNWVSSPLSVAYAFAMARAGARGETAAQIDSVFGFPAAGLHDAFNALTRQQVTVSGPLTRTQDGSKTPVVCLANGLFVAPGQHVQAPFLHTLAASYGAGVRQVQFGSPAAAQAINDWVSAQTAGRIKKLFDDLDPMTRLVLANAIYFKAGWVNRFGKSPTRQDSFSRADGTTVQVPMMSSEEPMRYAQAAGWQAVELPYVGGRLAMWVVVPSGRGSPQDLLAPAVLAEVATGLRAESVRLSMPRWDFATDLELDKVLPKLGLTAAFLDRQADFSGMIPGVFIGQAVHRANITVTESGTEAAAATGLGFPMSAPPPARVVVRADHPFAFAIVDVTTRLPLFVGQVADPSAR